MDKWLGGCIDSWIYGSIDGDRWTNGFAIYHIFIVNSMKSVIHVERQMSPPPPSFCSAHLSDIKQGIHILY